MEALIYLFNLLVVWDMAFIFPNSWDDDPIWLSYFSDGLKAPTSKLNVVMFHRELSNHQRPVNAWSEDRQKYADDARGLSAKMT